MRRLTQFLEAALLITTAPACLYVAAYYLSVGKVTPLHAYSGTELIAPPFYTMFSHQFIEGSFVADLFAPIYRADVLVRRRHWILPPNLDFKSQTEPNYQMQ